MLEVKNMDTSSFKNTACIVYPAQYPDHFTKPSVEELHSTILFLGDIDEDLGGIEIEPLMDVLSPVECNYLQYVDVKGWDLFGPDQNIPVLKLDQTPVMTEIRERVEFVLACVGIFSPSQFGYSPHVTIDNETFRTQRFPEWVLLRQPQLWYRGERVEIGSTRRAYKVGRPNDKYPIF